MNGKVWYVPNPPKDELAKQKLAEFFEEYRWAFAIRNSYGEIVEWAFYGDLGKVPPTATQIPPLFFDCDIAVYLGNIEINRIFAKCDHQQWVIMLLYADVHPDWDDIQSFSGYPRVNRRTSEILFRYFIDFDNKFHNSGDPRNRVMAGGAWMNSGFGTENQNDHLPDFVVLQCPHKQIKYKPVLSEV